MGYSGDRAGRRNGGNPRFFGLSGVYKVAVTTGGQPVAIEEGQVAIYADLQLNDGTLTWTRAAVTRPPSDSLLPPDPPEPRMAQLA